MRPFILHHATNPSDGVKAALAKAPAAGAPPTQAPGQFIAGGTTIIDLMKLDVMRPEILVDVTPLANAIEVSGKGIRFGSQVKMAEAAEHPAVLSDYPVLAQALKLAASQQIRNMASLGGNVLQRTRCSYFRDTSYTECNKREPGSGCAALQGYNRLHAILGISNACIASYPGDFAQALIALDASLDITDPKGNRTIPFAQLHKQPGNTPHIETTLAPGELISAITVPAGAWTRRSLYLKIRDRDSYAFALASAAVALDLNQGTVREVRIALGGVATVPWRSHEAEAALKGQALNEQTASAAADAAFVQAKTYQHNAFKAPLGKNTLIRALLMAAQMEV
ncbi:MAG: xanthine dehydrogenase family protein subunit M [Caldilineaceae bacterium]